MPDRFEALLDFLQRSLITLGRFMSAAAWAAWRCRVRLAAAAVLALLGYGIYRHPPFASVHRTEVLVRTNLFDGSSQAYTAGTVLVLPAVHQVRRYPTRDQSYRLTESRQAAGAAPFQSSEGLSLGVDLTVRWAIDRGRIAHMSREFPDDLEADLVRPAVQGAVYPLLARHTVREIFSSQRAQIQEEMSRALAPKLASLGLVLRGVDMGQVDLPPDYRGQMEKLLAEEIETEKIRYTLELREAQVKETQLAAEAAGEEQVIAARAQEETMRHILPFKQKQIEQRQLEAEAEKVARIRTAEGAAQARRIEAQGEADSRHTLADV
jgi:regulator of protease activity HflC (stomatin/prohibitin superfamily)